VNAALKLDGVSRWKNCVTGGWALLFFSRFYEDIRRAVGPRLQHHTRNKYFTCRAFWTRNGICGKHVQWKDKPTTEFCDFSERVCLAARIPKAERFANRHCRFTRSKHPTEGVLMFRELCNEFVKCRFPAAGTGAWKCQVERNRFAVISDEDRLPSFFRVAHDRKS